MLFEVIKKTIVKEIILQNRTLNGGDEKWEKGKP